nr:competence type IV pilus ATPase ComGA [Apilactobacillus ozensis]
MEQAFDDNISDIYILPVGNSYEVKFRRAHFNELYVQLSSSKAQQLINFCKYISNMSVSEHRRPQMGSIIRKIKSKKIYLRFSSVGDFQNRDSIVIRVLYSSEKNDYYDELNNPIKMLSKQNLSNGIVLFAGPTGSGKTTSIYNIAKYYGKNKMVMTIEDPIEIHEENFLQLQVNENSNMKYEDLLKVGLRNRPDIFIIGEIRDENTAAVAVKAALSGHLVLSTIHANSHIGVIKRLLKLGINNDYLKYAINSIIYQKLVPSNNDNMYLMATMSTNQELFYDKKTDNHYSQEWNKKLDVLLQSQKI